eukprot:CCRYP_007868-RA/>CCRYP_007868-RA protein AED:0.00 eAED:0.00 QI:4/1/1/1/1/1/3/299/565
MTSTHQVCRTVFDHSEVEGDVLNLSLPNNYLLFFNKGMNEIFKQSSHTQGVISVVRPSLVTLELIDGNNQPLPATEDTFDLSLVNTSSMKMISSDDQRVYSSTDPLARQDCALHSTTSKRRIGNEPTQTSSNPVVPTQRDIEETGRNETMESYMNFCDASIVDCTAEVIPNAVLVADEEVCVAQILPDRDQDTTTRQQRGPLSGKRFYVAILVVLLISLGVMLVVMPLTIKSLRDTSASNSQTSEISPVDGDSDVVVGSSTAPSPKPPVSSETVETDLEKSCDDRPCANPDKSPAPTTTAAPTGPVINEPPTIEPMITEPETTEPTPSPITLAPTERTGTRQPNSAPAKATSETTLEPTDSPITKPPTLSPSNSTSLWTQNLDLRAIAWLEAHNSRRKMFHEQYGKTYIPLVWSESLASDAQSWADQMNDGRECMGVTQNSNDYGQSVSAWSMTSVELEPPEDVLVDWVDDELGLDYPDNRKLTQALWRATKYLGCGDSMKEFTDNGDTKRCHVYVCNYIRKGNCNMDDYTDWALPMLLNDTQCGLECPSEGCFWEAFNTGEETQ